MVPDLEYVLRKRFLFGVIVRFAASVMLVIGSIPVLQALLQAMVLGPIFYITNSGSRWDPFEVLVSILWQGGPFLLVGAFLMMRQRAVSRWLVPLPRPECPRCGYNMAKLREPRCPECGLQLPNTPKIDVAVEESS